MCDRCEELEEKVRQLTELLGVTEEAPKYGLTPCEWLIYQIIAKRGEVSHRLLNDIFWATTGRLTEPDTIKVHCHRINKCIAKHGQRLRAVYGWGYILERIDEHRPSHRADGEGLRDSPRNVPLRHKPPRLGQHIPQGVSHARS